MSDLKSTHMDTTTDDEEKKTSDNSLSKLSEEEEKKMRSIKTPLDVMLTAQGFTEEQILFLYAIHVGRVHHRAVCGNKKNKRSLADNYQVFSALLGMSGSGKHLLTRASMIAAEEAGAPVGMWHPTLPLADAAFAASPSGILLLSGKGMMAEGSQFFQIVSGEAFVAHTQLGAKIVLSGARVPYLIYEGAELPAEFEAKNDRSGGVRRRMIRVASSKIIQGEMDWPQKLVAAKAELLEKGMLAYRRLLASTEDGGLLKVPAEFMRADE